MIATKDVLSMLGEIRKGLLEVRRRASRSYSSRMLRLSVCHTETFLACVCVRVCTCVCVHVCVCACSRLASRTTLLPVRATPGPARRGRTTASCSWFWSSSGRCAWSSSPPDSSTSAGRGSCPRPRPWWVRTRPGESDRHRQAERQTDSQ